MNMDYKLGEGNTNKFKGLGQSIDFGYILNLLAKSQQQIQEISLLLLQYKYRGGLLTVAGRVQKEQGTPIHFF